VCIRLDVKIWGKNEILAAISMRAEIDFDDCRLVRSTS
jgi:hypothetical protein